MISIDTPAFFSSRTPSPLSSQARPQLTAALCYCSLSIPTNEYSAGRVTRGAFSEDSLLITPQLGMHILGQHHWQLQRPSSTFRNNYTMPCASPAVQKLTGAVRIKVTSTAKHCYIPHQAYEYERHRSTGAVRVALSDEECDIQHVQCPVIHHSGFWSSTTQRHRNLTQNKTHSGDAILGPASHANRHIFNLICNQ